MSSPEVLAPTTNIVFAKPFGKTGTGRRLTSLEGLGLEYTESLTWSKWTPGEEFVMVSLQISAPIWACVL